jgi:Tfp pilus assembly protein PilX
MLPILIAGAVVVVLAMLGLGMCRLAALSDRKRALAITEWIATRHLSDRQAAFPGRSGEQSLLDPPGEVFRTAG